MTIASRSSETDTEGMDLRIPSVGGKLAARHFPATRDELTTLEGRPSIVMAHGIGAADGITAFDRLEAGTINGRAVLVP